MLGAFALSGAWLLTSRGLKRTIAQAANIKTTINDAFAQPFQLEQMIRITFVTGAGKLSRQKYDDKAMQTLTAALRDLGYAEDRGASCVNECGGSYKTQHDTGKNLFTVVVFPRLAEQDGGQAGGEGGSSPSDEYPIPFPLVEGTPVHTVLLASEETFGKMAPSMCPSWSEKKMVSEVLKMALETVEAMDRKLITGTPLSDDENAFYDEVGGATSTKAKEESVRKLMHHQVESGALTQHEIEHLVAMVQEKIDGFDSEIDAALQRSQEKKVAKLKALKEKADARKRMLEGHAAQPPQKLKHEAQIAKLKKQLQPLLKLEASTKGRLLTMKETKELAAKDDIVQEISDLEEASRGWFEDEETFQVRLDASRKRLAAGAGSTAKAASGGKGKKPGTGSRTVGSGSTTWLTPGGLAAKQAALGKKAAAKKPKPKSSGGVFAAMMMDSDSDSD